MFTQIKSATMSQFTKVVSMTTNENKSTFTYGNKTWFYSTMQFIVLQMCREQK